MVPMLRVGTRELTLRVLDAKRPDRHSHWSALGGPRSGETWER